VLTSLRIRDLATIADVTLELGEGLNVLTGETGAGKSMLVDALALLLGDRADRAAVRPGAAKAVVEGELSALPKSALTGLEQSGLDADDHLVIRREVTAEGRSRAWINGSPTTVGVLATLGATLVDLHGQHQTLQLLEPVEQRALLDAFGDALPAADGVAAAWRDLGVLRADRDALVARSATRPAPCRLAAPRGGRGRRRPGSSRGEDETLDRDINRLGQAGTLGERGAATGRGPADGDEASARTAVARRTGLLNALERHRRDVGPWRELLDGAYAQARRTGAARPSVRG
jgi:DNA repair protein RecN (Recombination protein N)